MNLQTAHDLSRARQEMRQDMQKDMRKRPGRIARIKTPAKPRRRAQGAN
jgi:plasmid maintenance system antidote protein VapI